MVRKPDQGLSIQTVARRCRYSFSAIWCNRKALLAEYKSCIHICITLETDIRALESASPCMYVYTSTCPDGSQSAVTCLTKSLVAFEQWRCENSLSQERETTKSNLTLSSCCQNQLERMSIKLTKVANGRIICTRMHTAGTILR